MDDRQPPAARIVFQHAYAYAHSNNRRVQSDYRMQAQNAPHNSRLVFANDLTTHDLMPSRKVLIYAYACAMVRLYGDATSQEALTQTDVTPGNSRRGQENGSERSNRDSSTGNWDSNNGNKDQEDGAGAGDGNVAAAHEKACKVVDSFRGAVNPHIVLPDLEPFETRITRWRSGVIRDFDPTSPHAGDVI